jgi:hypothetical protein
MEERDAVLHDVHGVSDLIDEQPEFIKESTESLLKHLERTPNTEKVAYLHALEQNPDYVRDEGFLLMFLRADRFRIQAAAARVTAFFETKMELFGRDKLGRDILISDLDENDISCLESGYAQILNGRDRAGRAMFCLMPMIHKQATTRSKVRNCSS